MRRIIFNELGISIRGNVIYHGIDGPQSAVLINVNRFIENVIYCIEKWMATKPEADYTLSLDITNSYKLGNATLSGMKDKGLTVELCGKKPD